MIAENIFQLQMRSKEILIDTNFKIIIPNKQLLFSKEEILQIINNSDYVGLIIFDQDIDIEDDLIRREIVFLKFLEQNFTKEHNYENSDKFKDQLRALKINRNSCDQYMQTPITIIINIKSAIYSNIFIIFTKIILNEWKEENQLDNFSKLCIKQWKEAEGAVQNFLMKASKSTTFSEIPQIPQVPDLSMPPIITFPKFEMKHKLS